MVEKNQTTQAAFNNTLGVPAIGKTVGSLIGGATFVGLRVSLQEREAFPIGGGGVNISR